ncbi:helix-turn-helix transcriptional regulator [Asticcacaulis sp. BYS171W]|uniref:Helix-turn-helix transcriptional regulator n=1 Tax=Asticcacaulis aquaticus TaxID=2984212 RepID=A0ABT5HQI8_9CAUL|nr:helix-turn-helix transcriptional regulator [Asticcacaulis aquaticus]MDC7682085.1 helix-turn-helix transcriptional regulator [Asticcacaulis aquaticus]
MRYEERPPSLEYAPYIERFWRFSVDDHDPPAFEHVIVPDGTISLAVIVIPTGQAFFNWVGPSAQAIRTEVHQGVRYFGARFHAGAFRALTGLEAAALAERVLPLAVVSPDWAAAMQACVGATDLTDFADCFEQAAQPWLDSAGPRDEAVCELARRLIAADGEGALPVHDLGVSERHLRRRFVREAGLSPKLFSRLRRVRRACIDLVLHAQAKAAVSADHGYADQPHFTRELKAVFGLSPEMLKQYLEQIRHIDVGNI